ncbi:MAG: dehalogenase [Dehalococcoides mccartyi]|uniref:dehalogenase n=1 Tax=Dehalococcoides mccartyi TaxID=61435 RepID=UPI000805D344|nr:dehalogenase [Dehalococcoides mccartyi]OBW62522.1 MAG: dehalogenase [Dehalococcoides mccartyi]
MWFTIGMIFGLLISVIFWLLKRNNLNLNWFEWIIGLVGFGLLIFTVQNFMGSFAELEPTAAYFFLLITGLPSLILLAIAWQLAIRRMKKT